MIVLLFYLDRSRIRLRLRLSRRIRFLRHFALMIVFNNQIITRQGCFFLDNLEGTTNSFIDKQIYNQIVFQETMRKCEHNNITKKKEKPRLYTSTSKKREKRISSMYISCLVSHKHHFESD